jgi:hypothetical protein
MSNIEAYRGGSVVGWQSSRAIARVEAGASLRMARMEAEAELQAAKTMGVA